jgi:hypothetical protein
VRTENASAIVASDGSTRMNGAGDVEVAIEVDASRFLDLFLLRVASYER